MLLAEPFGRALNPSRVGPRLAPPVGWQPNWRVPSVPVAASIGLIAAVVVGLRLAFRWCGSITATCR